MRRDGRVQRRILGPARDEEAPARSELTTVFVAATARSGPAAIGRTVSAASATGEAASLTSARVSAPPSRAARVAETRSGLRPDCEMTMKSAPSTRGGRR